MAGINKVILIGNLGRDPELRYTKGGTATCTLSLATTRSYTNRTTNERVDETEWHRVVLWGNDAENASKYLAKGRQVYVEGRLQTRKYNDKDGIERHSTEIVGEQVQYLGGRSEGSSGGGNSGRGRGGRNEYDQRSGPESYDQRTGGSDFDYIPEPAEDDIPF